MTISIPNPSAFAACLLFVSASANELIQISLNKADQSLSFSATNSVSFASVQLDCFSFDDDMTFFISVSDIKEIKKNFSKVDFSEILLELTDDDVVMSICGGYLTVKIPRYTSANIPKLPACTQVGKCTALVDSARISECLASFAFLAASKKQSFTEMRLHSNVVVMSSKSTELKKGIFNPHIVLAQVV